MAIKKSELYSSLWASCDELRGSMDASQYKDYVLVFLFMKYVSDKGGDLVDIPKGASFKDMIKLKGDPEIGDKINKIIGELAKANDLSGIITVADFNDDEKLGKGKEKIDRLSNLIEIFEKPELDFSSNRADGDDLLGDAYEYLMRHFATQSGKSKGQFYTPAEVSRVMAKVIGINKSRSQSESIYDPTCGSGSLLLRAAEEAPLGISIYGQENDNATRGLAVMNMWLHGHQTAEILQGNTLSDPQFKKKDTEALRQFDFAVANPPFSNKNWTNGLDPANDEYKRFEGYDNFPPKKNGDYAFLLHLIKSLKSNGKGAIVLPLGVLFRGNSEADIRKKIIQKGYIKGIIGLPPNLFYGTGIAACLVILDKENAATREDIFMIDASKGFLKDGNKNRLRERDIHRIVETFNKRLPIPKYSRIVPISEIEDPKNDYNLNIPRYIDSQEPEDIQDIEAHLKGGIPENDIDALQEYWEVYPSLKNILFAPSERVSYHNLCIAKDEIKNTIFQHPEFISYAEKMSKVFNTWKDQNTSYAKELEKGLHPKQEVLKFSESILSAYDKKPLTDRYAMYQHLMDYWTETMQDDMYELAAEGWKAGNEVKRIEKKTKKGDKEISKPVQGIEGLEGTLVPPSLLIQEYFPKEKKDIDDLKVQLEELGAKMDEIREDNGGEDGLLAEVIDDKGKISKKSIEQRMKELKPTAKGNNVHVDEDNKDEYEMLELYKSIIDEETNVKAKIKKALAELEIKVLKQYPKLSIDEIKTLVVDKKWMVEIERRITVEMDNISHRLTQRIKELAERYEFTLLQLDNEVSDLTKKVENHLKLMNFTW